MSGRRCSVLPPGLQAARGRSGFTLLEILVALAVMAIALVVVFQLFSANISGLIASDDYMNAVVRAEAKMREILDDDDIAERTWSEQTADGFRFDAAVAPAATERTDNLPVQLLEVTLKVNWTKGSKERSFTLKTMKAVNKKV